MCRWAGARREGSGGATVKHRDEHAPAACEDRHLDLRAAEATLRHLRPRGRRLHRPHLHPFRARRRRHVLPNPASTPRTARYSTVSPAEQTESVSELNVEEM